jgi:S-DNA-T family DNA segregation ATPase FtsK/SpoIIIE
MAVSEEQAFTILALAKKFNGLSINTSFSYLEEGPVITTYYFKLGSEVPIAKVMNKGEDFALACGVASVIIQRKEGLLGLQIPNTSRSIVNFDKCLDTLFTTTSHYKQSLPILLGEDAKGNTSSFDLTESPHLLIAGTTGAGKSVLLSSILGALSTLRSPEELRLILVDTKQVDLTLFASLPHVESTITDADMFATELIKLTELVRERMALMKGVARNIREYNKLTGAALPYYVVVIDEYADIVDTLPSVNRLLKQLIQISRAAGIHVIMATQRPSVKVIPGDIKANLGTRIALRLPSQIDSRTILNEGGAENLLGKGDMLVDSPCIEGGLQRYHGPFIDLDHIARILVQSDMIRGMYRMRAERLSLTDGPLGAPIPGRVSL